MKVWEFGLFDCFAQPVMCIWMLFVPFGMNLMQLVEGRLIYTKDDPKYNFHQGRTIFCACCMCCIGFAYNRMNFRSELRIRGTFLTDLCLYMCCPCCALMQEWRQTMLDKRGQEKVYIWRALDTPY
jgi:Cys-rich protein (TIGR01571 family)